MRCDAHSIEVTTLTIEGIDVYYNKESVCDLVGVCCRHPLTCAYDRSSRSPTSLAYALRVLLFRIHKDANEIYECYDKERVCDLVSVCFRLLRTRAYERSLTLRRSLAYAHDVF